MMGPRQEAQAALFYEFCLEDHVPHDHMLRSIDRFVDLSDIRQHLAPFELKYNEERAREIIADCLSTGTCRLGEIGGAELLKCYGFDVLSARLARSEEEAADIAEEITFPVVAKIVSKDRSKILINCKTFSKL